MGRKAAYVHAVPVSRKCPSAPAEAAEGGCVSNPSPIPYDPCPPGSLLPSLHTSVFSASNDLSKPTHRAVANPTDLGAHLFQAALPGSGAFLLLGVSALWTLLGHCTPCSPHLCGQLAQQTRRTLCGGTRPWLLPCPPAVPRARCPMTAPYDIDSGESITVAQDMAPQSPGLCSRGLRTPVSVCRGLSPDSPDPTSKHGPFLLIGWLCMSQYGIQPGRQQGAGAWSCCQGGAGNRALLPVPDHQEG